MPRSKARSRRRLLIIGILSGAVIITALIVVRFTFLRDHSSAVSLAQAQDRYRQDIARLATTTTTSTISTTSSTTLPSTVTASPTGAGATTTTTAAMPALMPFGIYRYRTTGQESIDALDGASHTYPDETTITVTPDGCGVLLRWDALKERRDEWRLCATADGIDLQPTGLQFHEFFGQPNGEDIVCDRGIVVVPPPSATTPLASQDLACTLAGDSWPVTWQVIGRETRSVEGQTVDVVHVRFVVEHDAEYYEHTAIDWYFDDQGLPIEANCTKTSRSASPIGAVIYNEQFSLQLISLSPVQ